MNLRAFTALVVGGTLALFTYPRIVERGALPAGVLVERVLTQIDDRYVAEVDRDAVLREGLDLMVQQLDRNTRYIKPDEVEAFDSDTEGQFVGLGVVLQAPRDDYPVIQSVIAGGPAEEAGILAGDVIRHVNGQRVEGISLDDLHERLQGVQGTVVKLRIARGKRERLQFEIPLDRVTVSTIGAVRLYADASVPVGYVRLRKFSRGTARDCRQAFRNLAAQGAAAWILDLRENSGGVLGEGIAVASQFLREGVILRTRGRDQDEQTYDVREPGSFLERNLIVLIDESSASASEFVAAALQDHRRALLVGADSYGKWTVQSVIPLGTDELDGLLKLTTSSFHRPDESQVYCDEHGRVHVHPNIEVPVDAATRGALFAAWQAEHLDRINEPAEPVHHPTPGFSASTDGTLVDAALVRALAILMEAGSYESLQASTRAGAQPDDGASPGAGDAPRDSHDARGDPGTPNGEQPR